MSTPFSPGDWVSGYRSGFFRVEKVIRQFYDESHVGGVLGGHQIGDEFDDPALVLKRGFNSKLNRSLGWDSCSAAHCHFLPQRTTARIEETLRRDPAFRKALDSYVIPPIQELHNIGLRLETAADRASFNQLIPFVQQGRTFREISAKMDELPISTLTALPRNATLQLVNTDFETVDRRLVFRDARLLI
jgi:hypothetical protein